MQTRAPLRHNHAAPRSKCPTNELDHTRQIPDQRVFERQENADHALFPQLQTRRAIRKDSEYRQRPRSARTNATEKTEREKFKEPPAAR